MRKLSAWTEAFAPFSSCSIWAKPFPCPGGTQYRCPLSDYSSTDGRRQTHQSLSYEIHLVQSDTFSTERISGGSPLTFGSTNTGNVFRYRALDANWNFVQQDQALCTLVFDRFNIKQSFDWGDITTGRQAITFGKTYFWNPLDVFFPFGASQFDRDYKPGVDALRVDIPFGRFSGLNLVGSAGPTIRSGRADRPATILRMPRGMVLP